MGGRITLVTGGARSGKSSYAEKLAKESTQPVAYIATAIPFDSGMKERIKKHQDSRPKEWTTVEGYKELHRVIEGLGLNHGTILLDCVTIMITNLMLEAENDWDTIPYEKIDRIEEEIKTEFYQLLDAVKERNLRFIIVTNELGMGIVPENRLSRIFRDIAGRVNQLFAKEAHEVVLTISGIPVRIK